MLNYSRTETSPFQLHSTFPASVTSFPGYVTHPALTPWSTRANHDVFKLHLCFYCWASSSVVVWQSMRPIRIRRKYNKVMLIRRWLYYIKRILPNSPPLLPHLRMESLMSTISYCMNHTRPRSRKTRCKRLGYYSNTSVKSLNYAIRLRLSFWNEPPWPESP